MRGWITKGRVIAAIMMSLWSAAPRVQAMGFDIQVNLTGTFTPAQQAAFTQAEALWESVLTGYQSGVVNTVVIDAFVGAIDGPGGTLASAGPTTGFVDGLNFLLTATGIMNFDSADIGSLGGPFNEVIAHEMGHVLGFGTLWNPFVDSGFNPAFAGTQAVYVSGTGEYFGANAVAAWQVEFNRPTDTFVPVELGGGPGTANGHWDENSFFVHAGVSPPVSGAPNLNLTRELMTGFFDAPTFLSNTTIASFADIGFTTILNPLVVGAVPEPGTLASFATVLLAVHFVRRRRRAAA